MERVGQGELHASAGIRVEYGQPGRAFVWDTARRTGWRVLGEGVPRVSNLVCEVEGLTALARRRARGLRARGLRARVLVLGAATWGKDGKRGGASQNSGVGG
jgi:hypothetical protein